ncbi:cystatin-9-like protein [Cricetulus griseus]|nr:cystatin-9-like protein [Cricetulus griseus]
MSLPWPVLLVLLGFQAQGAQAWCSEKDKPYIDNPVSDPDIVKFAVSTFNNPSKDEYTHRSIHIMSFSKVQENLPRTFFMKLRLRRTICKKSEESLDTCPLQDSP